MGVTRLENGKVIILRTNNDVGSSGEFGGPVVGSVADVGEVIELSEAGIAKTSARFLGEPEEGIHVSIPHPYDKNYYAMAEDPKSPVGGLCHIMIIDLGLGVN